MSKPMRQCEGRHRSIRSARWVWVQCPNNAIAMLTVAQDGVVTKEPSCLGCWEEAIERELPILSSRKLRI